MMSLISKASRRSVLIIFLLLIVAPLLLTLFFSFFNYQFYSESQQSLNFSVEWYKVAFGDIRLREAMGNAIFIGACTAIIGTSVSFLLALTWWDIGSRVLLFFLLVIWGIIPPEVQAISFTSLKNITEWYNLGFVFHFTSVLFGVLPYCILIIWGVFYSLDTNMFAAAKDLGAPSRDVVLKVIFPLSLSGVVSAFLLAFLLAFNEYTRTYYLSGANQYLSEYLNGKLMSGANASVYAIGGMNVFLAFCFLGIAVTTNYLLSKRMK